MKKILVTGKNGQLGSELRELLSAQTALETFFVDREELPLHEPEHIPTRLAQYAPDLIIHAGAYTAVDLAESEPELADRVNHLATEAIARYAHANGAKLIMISTDYVFDGLSSIPLTEDTPTSPINIYGATKLAGENAVRQFAPEAIIIRTSWVYSVYGKNFVKTMLRLMSERDEISVVDDQVGSPTYARDLAKAILDIAHSEKWIPGVYHFSNEGQVSWHGFATAIKKHIGSACNILPLPSEQYPTPAQRPRYSLLDKTKIKEVYGIEVPFWEDSLKECLRTMVNG